MLQQNLYETLGWQPHVHQRRAQPMCRWCCQRRGGARRQQVPALGTALAHGVLYLPVTGLRFGFGPSSWCPFWCRFGPCSWFPRGALGTSSIAPPAFEVTRLPQLPMEHGAHRGVADAHPKPACTELPTPSAGTAEATAMGFAVARCPSCLDHHGAPTTRVVAEPTTTRGDHRARALMCNATSHSLHALCTRSCYHQIRRSPRLALGRPHPVVHLSPRSHLRRFHQNRSPTCCLPPPRPRLLRLPPLRRSLH
jgi:hypothetical protein